MKTVKILAGTGTFGLIKKGVEKHLQRVPGHPNVDEIEKDS